MSKTLSLDSPAKINLTLDILKRDEVTGYHLIQTIFQRVSIFDTIECSMASQGFHFESNTNLDADNTVVKAYRSICDHIGRELPVNINLKKRIPSGAGLGGASSNAATVLIGINHLFSLNVPLATLMELGGKIGKDVPFFVSNASAAIGSHFGEKVTALPAMPDTPILVIFPRMSCPTREAYSKVDLASTGKHHHKTDMLIDLFRRGSFNQEKFLSLLHNDFEPSFFESFPKLHELKERLEQELDKVILSGSGSSFVCFGSKMDLSRVSERLRKKYRIFLTSTY